MLEERPSRLGDPTVARAWGCINSLLRLINLNLPLGAHRIPIVLGIREAKGLESDVACTWKRAYL